MIIFFSSPKVANKIRNIFSDKKRMNISGQGSRKLRPPDSDKTRIRSSNNCQLNWMYYEKNLNPASWTFRSLDLYLKYSLIYIEYCIFLYNLVSQNDNYAPFIVYQN